MSYKSQSMRRQAKRQRQNVRVNAELEKQREFHRKERQRLGMPKDVYLLHKLLGN